MRCQFVVLFINSFLQLPFQMVEIHCIDGNRQLILGLLIVGKTLAIHKVLLYIKRYLGNEAQENGIIVVEDFSFEAPKTKEFLSVVKNLNVEGKKVLLVVPEVNKNVYLSARNLQKAEVMTANTINAYKVLNADVVVVSEKSVQVIDEILTK